MSGVLRFPLFGRMLRCHDPELMDAEGLSEAALAQAYRQLRLVHDCLGNTRAVLRLLKEEQKAGEPRTVLDLGCGQGALLAKIRDRLGLNVVGIDLRPAPEDAPVPIHTGNAVTDPLPSADIAISVVMLHHLSEEEIAGLIANAARSCRRLILLDLVRHPVPLALFRVFVAPLLCRINALDGQTSIRRAFTAAEMHRIVKSAISAAADGSRRPVRQFRHTVAPLWIRQVVDISWD